MTFPSKKGQQIRAEGMCERTLHDVPLGMFSLTPGKFLKFAAFSEGTFRQRCRTVA